MWDDIFEADDIFAAIDLKTTRLEEIVEKEDCIYRNPEWQKRHNALASENYDAEAYERGEFNSQGDWEADELNFD